MNLYFVGNIFFYTGLTFLKDKHMQFHILHILEHVEFEISKRTKDPSNRYYIICVMSTL